jgi:hypothetical protein
MQMGEGGHKQESRSVGGGGYGSYFEDGIQTRDTRAKNDWPAHVTKPVQAAPLTLIGLKGRRIGIYRDDSGQATSAGKLQLQATSAIEGEMT